MNFALATAAFITYFLIGALIYFVPYALCRRLNDAGFGSSELQRLRRRLGHYAAMKDEDGKEVVGMRLTSGQHKILLGALKKIEAKNAIVAAVTFFAFAIIIRELVEARASLNGWQLVVSCCVLSTGLFLVVSRIDGAGHLGQAHFNSIASEDRCLKCEGRQMQVALMRNLLEKEAGFQASIWTLTILLLVAGMVLPLLHYFPGDEGNWLVVSAKFIFGNGSIEQLQRFWP